jgi:hypothetical protein
MGEDAPRMIIPIGTNVRVVVRHMLSQRTMCDVAKKSFTTKLFKGEDIYDLFPRIGNS